MARINIEDSLFRDPRFQEYLLICGDRRKALGGVIELWIIAQKFYTSNGAIPMEKFIELGLDENLIKCKLAEVTEKGVRVRGQDDQFSWLLEKSLAGKKSAKSRLEKYGTAQPNNSSKKLRTPPNTAEPLTLTLTPTLPLSLPQAPTNLNTGNNSENKTGRTKNSFCADAIRFYCEKWKEKYKVSYQVTGKDAGNINRLLNDVGFEKFKRLVDGYLKMNEPMFISKRHDFTSLFMNINKISHFEQTGIKVTSHDLRNIELQDHNQNSWKEAYESQRSKK